MSQPRLVVALDRSKVPWARVRSGADRQLAELLRLSDGTASLTIHLEYRDFDLVKVSVGGKLRGERA